MLSLWNPVLSRPTQEQVTGRQDRQEISHSIDSVKTLIDIAQSQVLNKSGKLSCND